MFDNRFALRTFDIRLLSQDEYINWKCQIHQFASFSYDELKTNDLLAESRFFPSAVHLDVVAFCMLLILSFCFWVLP